MVNVDDDRATASRTAFACKGIPLLASRRAHVRRECRLRELGVAWAHGQGARATYGTVRTGRLVIHHGSRTGWATLPVRSRVPYLGSLQGELVPLRRRAKEIPTRGTRSSHAPCRVSGAVIAQLPGSDGRHVLVGMVVEVTVTDGVGGAVGAAVGAAVSVATNVGLDIGVYVAVGGARTRISPSSQCEPMRLS